MPTADELKKPGERVVYSKMCSFDVSKLDKPKPAIVGRKLSMQRLGQYKVALARIESRHYGEPNSSVKQAAIRQAGESLIKDLQLIFSKGIDG